MNISNDGAGPDGQTVPDVSQSQPGPGSVDEPRIAAKVTRGDAATLARWFWLRLVTRPGGSRDRAAIEEHVRQFAALQQFVTEDVASVLDWNLLLTLLDGAEADVRTEAVAQMDGLRQRLESIATPLRLDDVACNLLVFGTVIQVAPPLAALGRVVPLEGPEDLVVLAAAAIDATEDEVADALGPTSALKQLALIGNRTLYTSLADALEPIRPIRSNLFCTGPIAEVLVRRFCKPVPLDEAREFDLSHFEDPRRVMQAFLAGSPSARILVYGAKGIGKSTFVRDVIRSTGWVGYAADLRRTGPADFFDAEEGAVRALALTMLRGRPDTVVVMNDAGVLRSSNFALRDFLDGLEVPTIWVVPSLQMIDDDVLERFDYIVELDVPSKPARVALLRRSLAPRVASDAMLEQVAGAAGFVPADAGRLARAVPLLTAQGMSVDDALALLAGRKAIGSENRPQPGAGPVLAYRREWLNADVDIDRLVAGLSRTGAGTLLFSGPPGTGKTLLARHLAERLGRPLAIRTVAELSHAHVGDTEKAIAAAFRDATREGAVLLLDEADSYVRSRDGAMRTWEVTQVNEMLTQLDQYPGVAILTTNALESLDSALMRRIDRKIEFGYLRRPDRWEVVEAAAYALGLSMPAKESGLGQQILGLENLALGDVAVVLRGERLEPRIREIADLHRVLREEVGRRVKERRSIGFVLA